MRKNPASNQDERSRERKGDLEAMPNAVPDDVKQEEALIAGQAGDAQALSPEEIASEESVEELAASGQALEASIVDGVEDAADHPERSVHTHEEYGRPDDIPARDREDDAA